MNKVETFHKLQIPSEFFELLWLEETKKIYIDNTRSIKEGDEFFLSLINAEGDFGSYEVRTTVGKIKELPCANLKNGLLELDLDVTAYYTEEGIFIKDYDGNFIEMEVS